MRWAPDKIGVAKAALFAVCLIPFAILLSDTFGGRLGPEPAKEITHRTGDWALRLLLVTLSVTPLRRLFGWNVLLRFRRMLGLYAFFYVCLHFLTYVWLDQFFHWRDIIEDIAKRPYITVGFLGFILLLPLALTSTNGMVRRIGAKNWLRLHRLVYIIAIAGVVHFLWLVKSDIREPMIYISILSVLLGVRFFWYWRKRAQDNGG